MAFPHVLNFRHIGMALFIMVLAYGVRSAVIMQRATPYDPAFFPPIGSDELFYYESAQALLRGEFPTAPYYYHPAITYQYALIMRLVGDNLFNARFGTILWDTLTVGVMIGLGWLLSQRAIGGYLAGLIWALYPVAIFYSTTFWDSSLSAGILAWTLFFVLWQRVTWRMWRTVILGFLAGWLVVLRLNLAPIAFLVVVLFVLDKRHNGIAVWQRVQHIFVFGICALLTVAPFTYWNYSASGGAFIPVATTGGLELYMGNNRNSNGLHGLNSATATLDISPIEGIVRDMRLDFRHWLGLTAYKFTTFWGASEIGNTYSYESVAVHVPLLQTIPITHSLLCLLGLLGLSTLWYAQRGNALYLGAVLLWLVVSVTISFVFSRIRFPSAVVLVILSAYFLAIISQKISDWAQKRALLDE